MILCSKHPLVLLPLLLIAAASNSINPVASQVTAYLTHQEVKNAAHTFCITGYVDPKYGRVVVPFHRVGCSIIMKHTDSWNNADRSLDDNVGTTFETEVEIAKRLGAASASDAYNDGNVSPLASAVQSLVMGGVALLAVV